jgi:hypothetical protein
MKQKLYLSSYYYDVDHPDGIVLIEFQKEDFSSYNLLKELYEEFIEKNLKKIDSSYYEIEQKDPDFSQKLLSEISKACEENTILAKDIGWKDFIKMHAMGWVVIELSRDKKEFYNDAFWKIE